MYLILVVRFKIYSNSGVQECRAQKRPKTASQQGAGRMTHEAIPHFQTAHEEMARTETQNNLFAHPDTSPTLPLRPPTLLILSSYLPAKRTEHFQQRAPCRQQTARHHGQETGNLIEKWEGERTTTRHKAAKIERYGV
jgi:hypothetical protein